MKKIPATATEPLKKYVRATNYLAVSQIYLKDNILLETKLKKEHIKPRLLGHWGTCPGINFVYGHVNRLIVNEDADMLYIVGPGHGFPAMQANLFVEKSLTHFYPEKIPYNKDGVREICSKFSAPYGYPSHSNPAAPGAILEGGELGYSLSVSFGTVLDNPDLITCCLVGDGEAETGPLAAAWHVNKLLDPIKDGAVLPILHDNGYKISGPTIFGRMHDTELTKLFEGYGYEPFIVDEAADYDVYQRMAEVMDLAYSKIRAIQTRARNGEWIQRPKWPMIVLRTPKGWTGAKFDDVANKKLEGNCASHQVILEDIKENPKHLKTLENWMKSYQFDKLMTVNKKGEFKFDADIRKLIPKKGQACGSQPYAYGGDTVQKLQYPDINKLTLKLKNSERGQKKSSSMKEAGKFLEHLFGLNVKNDNIRLFSPDETYSNKIDAVFKHTARSWQWPIKDFDTDLSRSGKVMEMLSEHTLFGLQHGYTVTGRHGLFVSYEAFVQVIASMADQYAKYLKASLEVDWRKPLPPVNIILTSLLERQDHNGFSHQNPSFLSSMMEKDGELIAAYLPPDSNCMLYTMEEIFKSRNRLNLVVAGKKPQYNWLTPEEAKIQMDHGIMTWDFASDPNPDVVLAASGDYVTNESLAALQIFKKLLPKSRIRFVNVSELTALGVGDTTVKSSNGILDQYFTHNKGVVFNFHGYPHTIKKLLFDYSGAHRVKVNGYLEEGSTTTPFDMEARNRTSRYHLVMDLAEKLYGQEEISEADYVRVVKAMEQKLHDHKLYILEYGEDPEAVEGWR